MLPPQNAAGFAKLARSEAKKQKSQTNRASSQNHGHSQHNSIFKDEFNAQKNQQANLKPAQKKEYPERRKGSEEFVTFGKMIDKKGQFQSSREGIDHNFKLFNKKFQDDLTYLVKYAVQSNADRFNLSPHKLQLMKDQAEGKPSLAQKQKEEKIKKQKEFVDRNYNKQFQEQQKVFDQHRAKKKLQLDSQNNYEKIDPKIWKTSLALMKYQVTKDTYQIEDNQRKMEAIYGPEPTSEEIEARIKQEELQRKKEEQIAEQKKRKKTEVKAINVKINVDLDNGFKKIVQKSDEEVAKSVKRLISINSRQNEVDDKKVNTYFIRIEQKLAQLLKLKPGPESAVFREKLMRELSENEQQNQQLSDQIIGKYESVLVEKIIDDLLMENVFLLQFIEKKKKLPKKQVKKTILQEYKEAFIEYFDDSQEALANLMQPKKDPTYFKTIRLDSVLVETGLGVKVSALDAKNAFYAFSQTQDHRLKNNIALFNIIARDLTEELLDDVVESFDKCASDISAMLFDSEFQ